jgi:hypothetical protein
LGLLDYACVVAMDEPLTWKEAFKRGDMKKWKEVTNEKYCALMKNET